MSGNGVDTARVYSAFGIAGFLLAAGIAAAEPFSVSPSPGLYSSPQLIAISPASDTRLEILLDGASVDPASGPIFLDTPVGTTREFRLSIRSLPTDPTLLQPEVSVAGTDLRNNERVWVIDRRAPSAPHFFPSETGGGIMQTCTLDEPGTVHWLLWHPFYRASSSGSIPSGSSVFVPAGASLCAWGVDDAGNRGPASGIPASEPLTAEPELFRLVNPVPGDWSNRQGLVIEKAQGVDVRYTLDGSDPAVSGTPYTEPVMIEATGVVVLRAIAVDRNGITRSEKVLFTVTGESDPPVERISGLLPVTGTGEFAEFFIPEKYTYGIGDGIPFFPGGKSVLFTGVRGIRTFYPLVVSEGSRTWRYIIGCGDDSLTAPIASTTPIAPTTQAESPKAVANGPVVRVLDWHFITIDYASQVFVSLDGNDWRLYSGPELVDRAVSRVLKWYSPSWKGGSVQTLRLPSKPVLSGIPPTGISADPVFISSSDPAWTLRYRAVGFAGSEIAAPGDPELASGLLVEAPLGSSGRFAFSFLAICDGVVHGSFGSEFTIDRKPPRAPNLSLMPDAAWSRTPVSVSVTAEDTVNVDVLPKPLYSGDNLTLPGSKEGPVTYSITATSVDLAGNRSATSERTVTVDLNAIYVDPAWSGLRGSAPDGSPSAPYLSLDLALETIRDAGSWRIYLAGDARLSKSHSILAEVRILGAGHQLEFAPGCSLAVSNGSLALESCAVSAQSCPGNGGLIAVTNGSLSARDVTATVKGDDFATFVKAVNSDVSISNSLISVESSVYSVAFDLHGGGLSLSGSSIAASSRTVSALSLVSARTGITASTITIQPAVAGRAIEAWSSPIVAERAKFVRLSPDSAVNNKDSAIWTDSSSTLKLALNCSWEGFARERQEAPR